MKRLVPGTREGGYIVVSEMFSTSTFLLTRAGMAMRLAFDLGLHLDMTPYVEKGTIPYVNYEVRRTTFWAVYMNEQ